MQRHVLSTFALAAALTLGFGNIAMAETPEEPPTADTTATQEAPAAIYGMQAWIDAESGELRGPTADEAARMADQWRGIFGKAKAEPRMITDASGMTAVELDSSILKFSVARIDADGNLEAGCVKGAEKALEFVEAAASHADQEEK